MTRYGAFSNYASGYDPFFDASPLQPSERAYLCYESNPAQVSVQPRILSGKFLGDPATVAWIILGALKKGIIQDTEQLSLGIIFFQQALEELRQLNDAASRTEVAQIYNQAIQLPGIGQFINALFSPASLPGTGASLAAAFSAVRLNKTVGDLLDIDDDKLLQRLKSWGARPGAGIKSARLKFPDLHITKVDGQWVFEIPAKRLPMYYVKDAKHAEGIARIPIGGGRTFEELIKTARITAADLDKVSFAGKLMRTIPSAGLTFGPQIIVDAINANSFHNFLYLEAHDETSNVIATMVGVGLEVALGAFPAAPVIIVGLIVGVLIQVVCSHKFDYLGHRSINDWAGDHIVRKS